MFPFLVVLALLVVPAGAVPGRAADRERGNPVGPATPLASNSPGDPTFGTNGLVVLPGSGSAYAVARQADSKLLAAGQISGTLALARFTAAGQPDPTFGAGGVAPALYAAPGRANAVAVQQNGKVLIAGGVQGAGGVQDFALARYLPSGQPDPTVGGGSGKAVVAFGGFHPVAQDVAILAEGTVVVAAGNPANNSGGLRTPVEARRVPPRAARQPLTSAVSRPGAATPC
jgi:uncharacterized delta-60 repeat protein